MTTLDTAQKTSASAAPSKGLNIGLWVAQVLLALVFGMAGSFKVLTPIAELAKKMPWVADLPSLVRFIGASELLGALGMILPAATRIKPILTPLAGVGMTIIMILAAAFHLSRGEISSIGLNFILGSLAIFVVWGRFRKAPIAARA